MRHRPPSRPRAGGLLALVVLLLVPVSVGVGVPGVPGVPGPVPAEASTPVTPMIASGGSHTCELVADGTVRCWGLNASGQLGDGTTTDRPHRVTVRLSAADGGGPLTGVAAISAGDSHTCALLDDGTIRCWGENRRGQLGVATTGTGSDPRPHPETALTFGSSTATAVAAGGQHTCALLSDATVRCWGGNDVGQLGNGATSFGASPTPTPVFVSGTSGAELSGVTRIAAGSAHTCAVLDTIPTTMRCWGSNMRQQLGDGTTDATVENPAVVVGMGGSGSLEGITEVAAGTEHTCALTSSGNVRCWGGNDAGQVGDGTTSQATSPTPVLVSGTSGTELSGVTAIAVGSGHTCALTSGGAAQCWGANSGGGIATGQIGDGTSTNRSNPVAVRVSGTSGATLTGVTSIAPAGQHACALLDTGAARCWGRNDFGQVGLGRVFDSSSSGVLNPVVVRSATDPAGVLAVPAPSCSAKFSTTSTMDAPFAQLTEAAEFWVEVTLDRGQLTTWASALTGPTTGGPLETLWGIAPSTDLTRADLRLDVRAAGASPATGSTGTSATVTPTTAFGAGELGELTRSLLGPDAGAFADEIGRMSLRRVESIASGGTGGVTDLPASLAAGLDDLDPDPNVTRILLSEVNAAVAGWGLATPSADTPLRPEVVLSLRLAVGAQTPDEQMVVVLPCGGPAPDPTSDDGGSDDEGASDGPGPSATGPAVACAPDALTVGTEVTCTVTGGDPGIDILWRAAINPVIASEGVTLDADGRGTFGFTVPPSAAGSIVTVELVGWTAPVSIGGGDVVGGVAGIGGPGGPVPTSVPAGEGGTGPGGLLALIALLGAVGAVGAVGAAGASRGRRPGFCPVEKSSQNP